MAKAFSYIRFSSPQQALGDSLRRQVEGARTWARDNGYELDETLRDEGISAFKGANKETGALGSFLGRVKSGEIPAGSVLIVESLDRLSRETVIEASLGLFALIKEGITVVTLSDNQTYNVDRLKTDWTPLIVSLSVMARAHEESRTKSLRISQAWSRKKELAREQGTPLTANTCDWLRVENGKYVTIPERVQIIQDIFQWTIEGYGRRVISRMLNDAKVPTFGRGKGWYISTISKILENRAVLGEFQPHTGRGQNRTPEGEPIKGYYPQIIDEQTFYQAKSSSASRLGNGGRKGAGIPNLFQHIMFCECGAKLRMINKGSGYKGGRYLTCSDAERKNNCDHNRHYRLNVIEDNLLNALSFLHPKAFTNITKNKHEDGRIPALSGKLSELEGRREKLLELLELGDDLVTERFKTVSNEIKELKAEIRREKEILIVNAVSDHLEDEITELKRIISMPDDSDKQKTEIRTKLADIFKKLELNLWSTKAYGLIATIPRVPLYLDGTVPAGLKFDQTGIYAIISEENEETIERFIFGR